LPRNVWLTTSVAASTLVVALAPAPLVLVEVARALRRHERVGRPDAARLRAAEGVR
jgi:hypothetical protein